MTRTLTILFALTLSFFLSACKSYPLRANMSDSEFDNVLSAKLQAGMTVDQVKSTLSNLRVSEGRMLVYPQTPERPQVLLARIPPPGGMWPTQGEQVIEWTDISFVFQPSDHLSQWKYFRDGIRYFEGDPINAPKRALLEPVPHLPGEPAPPVDPLEGVTGSSFAPAATTPKPAAK